jgi:hypothetical protein
MKERRFLIKWKFPRKFDSLRNLEWRFNRKFPRKLNSLWTLNGEGQEYLNIP